MKTGPEIFLDPFEFGKKFEKTSKNVLLFLFFPSVGLNMGLLRITFIFLAWMYFSVNLKKNY